MTPRFYFRLLMGVTLAVPLPIDALTPSRAAVEYVRTIPSVREFTKPRAFFSKVLQ